ncbi:aminopeptidase [Deinococcus metalli]|uniref:Aminopeptidase n=1 Tax=Deinococcus metalli TaxID=1141878 RepID=A0A7W8KEA7_9DEIO|nr:aminopeptidase [Deinococcus metalli]MBB5376592.1 aminopeptidase [Deinococcus metalli]GHF42925.1 aminopeptidase [Deinococcus metalli]
MTYDPVRHAVLLADYCVTARPGDRVLISGSTLALPLIEALHRTLLERGARPVLRLSYPTQQEDVQRLASDDVLDSLHPVEIEDARALDASIRILTPTPPVADVPASRAARWRAAQAPVALSRLHPRWNLTLYPTPFGAEAAGMTLPEYETFVARAMFLDTPDPVQKWGEIRDFQAGLITRLALADDVHIVSAGTDLHLSVRGRNWSNSDAKRNMPSGEVFTAPLERSANGVAHFDLPTLYGGRVVRGIDLTFKDGEVVEARAEEGEDVLRAALETDEGARFLGELGIGTNAGIQQPSMNILFDEKIGGTVHLAVGQAYAENGGTNTSAVHWDMICDLRKGGRVTLDGEPFQVDGHFVS